MAKERKSKERPLLEPVENGESRFARALGSVDFHTREKGLQALSLWLSSRKQGVPELELLRLWKGIFFCFWHSDKAPVQAALADRLSDMMLQLPEQVALQYYTTFIKTLRREWFGIDHLRLDKFLMLVRKFFRAALRLLQAVDWAPAPVEQFTGLWLHQLLLPQDARVAAGLAYHHCDLLLPELGAVCSAGAGPLPQQPTLLALLEPFSQGLADTRDPALVNRARQGVFDPLVDEVASGSSPWDSLDAAALAQQLFDLGARQETRAKNREVLYAISAALEKAAKKQGQQRRKGRAEQAQQQGDAGQQQQLAAGKKKKKRRSQKEAAQPPAAAVDKAGATNHQASAAAGEKAAAAPAAAAAAPAGKGKQKAKQGKAAAAEQQELEQQQPQQPARKKQRQHAAGGGESTPQAAPTAAAPAAVNGTTGGKKNVRFSLRRNLVMTIGQPPLPEEVRTPPTSKPKGPALKPTRPAGSAPGRLDGKHQGGKGGSRLAQAGSGSASAGKAGGAKRKLTLSSPEWMPRSRAAEFF